MLDIAKGHIAAEELMTEYDAAEYLDRKVETVRGWRYQGVGPAYYKIGGLVRYIRPDLDAWVATRITRVTPSAVAS